MEKMKIRMPLMCAIVAYCLVGLMAVNSFASPLPIVLASPNGKAKLTISNLHLESDLTVAIGDPTFFQAWEGAPLAALIDVSCGKNGQFNVHPFDTAIAPYNMTSSISFTIYDERYVNELLTPRYGFYYGYNNDSYGAGQIREFHLENTTIVVDRTPGNAHVTLTAVTSFKGLPRVIGVGPIVPIANYYGSRPAFGTLGVSGRCLCPTSLGAEGFHGIFGWNYPMLSRDVLDAIYIYGVGCGPAMQMIDAVSHASKPILPQYGNSVYFYLRYDYNTPLPSPLPPARWTQNYYDYGLGWLTGSTISGGISGNSVTSNGYYLNPPQPTDYMWYARY